MSSGLDLVHVVLTDRVPRTESVRTASGPEGSSAKDSLSGAAAPPDPSRRQGNLRGCWSRRRSARPGFSACSSRETSRPGRAEAAIRVARRPARNTVSGTQAAARRGGEEVAVAWRVRLPTTEIVADTTTAHMATSSANVARPLRWEARPLRWEPQTGHAQRPRSEGHSDDPDGRAPAAPPPHRRRCRSDAKLGDGCVPIASADASDQDAAACRASAGTRGSQARLHGWRRSLQPVAAAVGYVRASF